MCLSAQRRAHSMVLDDRAGYKIHDIKTMGLEDDAVAMKMLRDAAWQVGIDLGPAPQNTGSVLCVLPFVRELFPPTQPP